VPLIGAGVRWVLFSGAIIKCKAANLNGAVNMFPEIVIVSLMSYAGVVGVSHQNVLR
jgi:hypothetical protein